MPKEVCFDRPLPARTLDRVLDGHRLLGNLCIHLKVLGVARQQLDLRNRRGGRMGWRRASGRLEASRTSRHAFLARPHLLRHPEGRKLCSALIGRCWVVERLGGSSGRRQKAAPCQQQRSRGRPPSPPPFQLSGSMRRTLALGQLSCPWRAWCGLLKQSGWTLGAACMPRVAR